MFNWMKLGIIFVELILWSFFITCGNMASFMVAGWRWLTNLSSCCKRRSLVARSFDANNLTTHGITRRWYSASGNCRPNCKSGGKTALPASPNSKAANNCGRILNRPTPSGKLSNWLANWAKNRPFSPRSFIWISSRKRSASTRSFLKKPPLLRHRAITSAGLGLPSGWKPVNSRYTVNNCFGIYENKFFISISPKFVNNKNRQFFANWIFEYSEVHKILTVVDLRHTWSTLLRFARCARGPLNDSQIRHPRPHMSMELFIVQILFI